MTRADAERVAALVDRLRQIEGVRRAMRGDASKGGEISASGDKGRQAVRLTNAELTAWLDAEEAQVVAQIDAIGAPVRTVRGAPDA